MKCCMELKKVRIGQLNEVNKELCYLLIPTMNIKTKSLFTCIYSNLVNGLIFTPIETNIEKVIPIAIILPIQFFFSNFSFA